MSLAEGQRLGPYEVLGRIGAGGMGEVYRARDTRLDRTVALKVLPSEFSADAALRSRFDREAKAISALAHPHICTLFDVGEQDGRTFLVMEHLEGQTLLERLRKGPLPLAQAVEVATQMADALSAAHKQGIVHRDLKPGNVMLTNGGAMLLDFGLARLTAHGERPVLESSTTALTETTPLTGQGTLLGTLPYMAPEQLEGKPGDARTDLWALGLLIYEMVTGRRAFEGQSQVSLIGAIVEREPEPLARLQPLTPPALERLVKRCLAKSPDNRWDTAHDVADELRWIAETGPPVEPTDRKSRGRQVLGFGAIAIVCIVAGLLADRWMRPAGPPVSPIVHSLLDVSPATELNAGGNSEIWLPTPGGSRTALDWTPDGRALVFVGRRAGVQQLYVRELDHDEARPLADTEGAKSPVVSIDGRWVAFWAMGAIKRTLISKGPTTAVVPTLDAAPTGMAWGASGRLYYGGPEGRIWRVVPEGAPEAVTTLSDGEFSHGLPQVLPEEKVLLFTVRRRERTWGDEEIVAQTLSTGKRTILLHDAVQARYVSSGHLLFFLRRGVLLAVRFDPDKLVVHGQPVPVLDGIVQALSGGNSLDITGMGQFSVSARGTLAYLAGTVQPYPARTVVTFDRQGRESPTNAPPRSYSTQLRLSPDGRRLVIATRDIDEHTLWILDRSRGTLARLRRGGELYWPLWTPDGQRIAFGWVNHGANDLVWQRAEDSAPADALVRGEYIPSSWSPDGRRLATVRDGDIWVVTTTNSQPTVDRLTETTDSEMWPEFSPDGRWLAYGSNTTGRFEIYVQPWPGPGPRVQLSLEGGESPAWNHSGRELFFASPPDADGRRRMMAVDVQSTPRLQIGQSRRLFDIPNPDPGFACAPVRCYDVSPDGQRFFVTQLSTDPPKAPPVTQIRLIQGWLEEVKARLGGD
jgi:serine/threonine protein kinase